MFRGEFESLKAIKETGTVAVPKPIKVIFYYRSKNTYKSMLKL